MHRPCLEIEQAQAGYFQATGMTWFGDCVNVILFNQEFLLGLFFT